MAVFVFLDNFVLWNFSIGEQCFCLLLVPPTSLSFFLSSHSEEILIFDTEFHNIACVAYSSVQGPCALRSQCRRTIVVLYLIQLACQLRWPGFVLEWPMCLLFPPTLTSLLHVANQRLLIMSQELYAGFSGKQKPHLSFWFKCTPKLQFWTLFQLSIYLSFGFYLCYLVINLTENPLG